MSRSSECGDRAWTQANWGWLFAYVGRSGSYLCPPIASIQLCMNLIRLCAGLKKTSWRKRPMQTYSKHGPQTVRMKLLARRVISGISVRSRQVYQPPIRSRLRLPHDASHWYVATLRETLARLEHGHRLPRLPSSGSGIPASAKPLARRLQLSHEPHGISSPL